MERSFALMACRTPSRSRSAPSRFRSSCSIFDPTVRLMSSVFAASALAPVVSVARAFFVVVFLVISLKFCTDETRK